MNAFCCLKTQAFFHATKIALSHSLSHTCQCKEWAKSRWLRGSVTNFQQIQPTGSKTVVEHVSHHQTSPFNYCLYRVITNLHCQCRVVSSAKPTLSSFLCCFPERHNFGPTWWTTSFSVLQPQLHLRIQHSSKKKKKKWIGANYHLSLFFRNYTMIVQPFLPEWKILLFTAGIFPKGGRCCWCCVGGFGKSY